MRYPRYQNQSATTIIFKDLLWGNDNGHLWFLPTLFLMLALSIILVKLCGTGIRLDITMTVLSILFVAMFGLMQSLIAVNVYLLQFTHHYIFFVLGFIYHRHEHLLYRQHGHSMLQHIVPKPVAALMLIACLALSWRVWSGSITLVFSVISVFTIYMLMPQHSTKFLQLISKDSMGIYLFHSPMLYISFTYWPDINPILMMLINFIGFGSIAILLTELMRRVHFSLVIGE